MDHGRNGPRGFAFLRLSVKFSKLPRIVNISEGRMPTVLVIARSTSRFDAGVFSVRSRAKVALVVALAITCLPGVSQGGAMISLVTG